MVTGCATSAPRPYPTSAELAPAPGNRPRVGDVSAAPVVSSSDHRLLAIPGTHGEIFVVDSLTGETIHTIRQDSAQQSTDAPANITCLAFSPDGRTLLSATSGDSAVKLWGLADGALVGTLAVPSRSVTNVSFSADGTRLAVAGYSLHTQIWDIPARRLIASAPTAARYGSTVALSPDGARVAQIMATSPSVVTVFDASTFTAMATAPTDTEAGSLAFSTDGAILTYSLYEQNQLALWHLASNTVLRVSTQPAAHKFGLHSGVVYSAAEHGESNPPQIRS